MLGFTRKTDYALVALATLAEESATRGGRTGHKHLSARQIAERHGVPLPLLMNVLKDLVTGGLVTSMRGARGGYSLARVAERISVRDVIAAIEGPVKVLHCCEEDDDEACLECRVVFTCPITGSVRQLNERINEYLREVSLADLMSANANAIGPVAPRDVEMRFRPLAKGDR